MNQEMLKQIEARAKQFNQTQGPPTQMTTEIMGAIKSLRKKKLTYRSIYEAMKERGLFTYKNWSSFYCAFQFARKNRG